MNTITVSRNSRPVPMHLVQGEPRAFRASRGTVVGCLSGHLWITQEGHAEDYMVPAGYCYSAGTDGLLLINATEAASTALVYWRSPAESLVMGVVAADGESRRRLVQSAHALRHKTINAMAATLLQWLCRRGRGLLRRLGLKPVAVRHVPQRRYSH